MIMERKLRGYTLETIEEYFFTANFIFINGQVFSKFYNDWTKIELKAGNGLFWAEVEGKRLFGVIKVVTTLLPLEKISIENLFVPIK